MSRYTHLPRRTFLKGLGTVMALPMLDAMRPASARAAKAAKAPTRLAFVFFPNGCIQSAWKPQEAGEQYELTGTLQPLAEFKSELIVFGGLAQDNGRAKGDGPGDHARCAASFLTGAHPYKTASANIRAGISVDQVAAERIGHQTRLPSLELGIERGRNAGNCDSGYSCAYSSNVSWKSATTPVAKEINPKLAFERLFGSNEGDEASREKHDLYRKSILDLVAADASRLKKRLGQTDRRKIDEYFTSVRELELRIERTAKAVKETPDFTVPAGVPSDFQEYIRVMFDLLVLAFQTDCTRVSTFMLGNAGSNRAYRMVGVKEGWHSLSHHGGKEEKILQIKKIDKYLVTQFAYFLKKLQSVKEGDGTLLDNSMILYGSGLGDGNKHSHHDLPILLAGRGGGTIQTGRHVKFKNETPLCDLFLSLLDRVGANVKSLGDSSGRLKGLEG
jgi:hypothetical protein